MSDSENDLPPAGEEQNYVPTYAEAFPELPMGTPAAAPSSAPRRPVVSVAGIRSSNKTEIVSIPYEEQRFKKGSLGRDVEKIVSQTETSSGARISVSYTRTNDMNVTITGKADSVSEAKRSILSKLQTQASIQLQIPKKHHGSIIGPQGSNLKKISSKYACRVNLPKSDDKSDVIEIIGTAANCRLAAKEIQAISDEKDKYDNVNLQVLKAYHPLIAGFNNQTLKNIQETCNVKIYVPPPSSDRNEIGVTGEKAGVQTASRQILAIYEEKKRTCGELNATVPKSQHRYVIGPKGIHLKEIMEKTGVVVEIPPSDGTDETVILRGVQANLVHALTMVYEKAHSVQQVKLQIPGWLHKHCIGKGGSNMKDLKAKFPKVHIDFEEASNEVSIEGPPADAETVKESLRALAGQLEATLAFADVKVDRQYHRYIIGSQGSNIKSFKEQTGAQIDVPSDESGSDVIRVEGTPQAVAAAKKLIADFATKLKNQRSIDLIVPHRWHSQLIGAGGSNIRRIHDLYPELNIAFPDKSSDSDIISLRGDKKDVEAVEKDLMSSFKRIEKENFELEVPVFRQYHGEIVGKGGAAIRQMQDETQTRISAPGLKGDSDYITVIGEEANCRKAEKLLLEAQARIASIVTETIQIPQNLRGIVIGPQGKFIKSLESEHHVQVQLKPKSDDVTIRGPAENVPEAIAQIKKLVSGGGDAQIEEIEVDKKHHKFLVGRKGANSAKFLQESGLARIVFPWARVTGKEGNQVTLIGSKDAIAKGKAMVADRVKELENTVDTTVEIDPKFMSGLRDRKTQFRRNLEDELGVRIRLPRGDSESEGPQAPSGTVSIRGSPAACEEAAERITSYIERLENSVSEVLTLDVANVPAVIGSQGSNLQRIQQDCNVSVDIPRRDSRKEGAETVDVTVTGLRAEVDAALAELKALVPIVESYDLDAIYHRFLVANKGEMVRALQDETSVRIEIPKRSKEDEEPVNQIQLRGLPVQVEAAKKTLDAKMPELEDAKAKGFEMTIEVDSKHFRTLIGSKGSNVNRLRKEFDVRVDFPKGDGNTVKLTGYEEKCKECAEDIQKRVAELDSHITKTVDIHPAVHVRIIGAKGAKIKQLRQDHKVEINIPGQRDSPAITIEGPAEGVDNCIEELLLIEAENEELIDEYQERTRFERPSRQAAAPAPASAPYAVRDAPWNGDSNLFPTLGASSTPASVATHGAWAVRR